MSILYLVRHGQASFGAERYDQLSELGQRQAAATGQHLAARSLRFDEVCIGPRLRHRQTAEAALVALPEAPPLQLVPALDEFADGEQVLASAERHFGISIKLGAGVTRETQLMHYMAMITAWLNGSGVIDGARSAQEFRAGIRDWLGEHRQSADSGRQTLAFTSAGTIAVMLCELLELPLQRMVEFVSVIANASVTEILHTPSRIALRCFNSAGHLSPELTTVV